MNLPQINLLRDYRVATSLDYERILDHLRSGDVHAVYVRRLADRIETSYPLLNIARGEFSLTEEGLQGFSLQGVRTIVVIGDDDYVKLWKDGEGWLSLDFLPVMLLIRK